MPRHNGTTRKPRSRAQRAKRWPILRAKLQDEAELQLPLPIYKGYRHGKDGVPIKFQREAR